MKVNKECEENLKKLRSLSKEMQTTFRSLPPEVKKCIVEKFDIDLFKLGVSVISVLEEYDIEE